MHFLPFRVVLSIDARLDLEDRAVMAADARPGPGTQPHPLWHRLTFSENLQERVADLHSLDDGWTQEVKENRAFLCFYERSQVERSEGIRLRPRGLVRVR